MTSLEELWTALRRAGQETIAPTLVRNGVRSLNQLALSFDTLTAAGLKRWQLEAVLASVDGQSSQEATASSARRGDLPNPVQGKRANIQAAMEAAQPNNRRRSLELLDQDVLAKSTNPANEARVRTYMALMRCWELPAFPLDSNNVRAFGASLKAGAYKSSAVYYSAICAHQQRVLKTAVPPIVKLGIRDCIRSIQRGLGTSQLKDSFNALLVGDIKTSNDESAFDLSKLGHARDMVVIGLWYMLREAEMAAATCADIQLEGREVHFTLPMHKTDQRGCYTVRTLSCSCGARAHPLCIWHSAERHLIRVGALMDSLGTTSGPLFPREDGQTAAKTDLIEAMRIVIAATGTSVTRLGPAGAPMHRFQGHVLRVSGAQMMAAAGIEIHLIQLLGRWSSSAVLRYTQDAALVRVPQIPAQILGPKSERPTLIRLQPQPGQLPEPMEAPSSSASRSPRPKASASGMRSLRAELEMIKEAVAKPPATYVFRPRARILHKASDVEKDNEPYLWKTPCGWSYGTSNYLRTTDLASGVRQCRKCFNLDDNSSSSSSEDSSDLADMDVSSESSEEG